MAVEELSEREREILKHLQMAEELEVTIAEYARSFDLDAKEIYNTKRVLIRKGAIAARVEGDGGEQDEQARRGDFVPVQVALPASSTAQSSSGSVCCIRYPSGLVIECASFPPASWLAALLAGVRDVPA